MSAGPKVGTIPTYSYRGSPSGIVDTGIRAPPLQRVDAIITVLTAVLETVGHRLPVSRGL